MLGSSVGKIRLNERSPPTSMPSHAWNSKTLYRTLPLNAGFFFWAVDERGAKVAAAWRENLETSFPTFMLLLAPDD